LVARLENKWSKKKKEKGRASKQLCSKVGNFSDRSERSTDASARGQEAARNSDAAEKLRKRERSLGLEDIEAVKREIDLYNGERCRHKSDVPIYL